ncbi:enoyl-CoA hydratase-related protein, partial [Gemmatimonadota bacterium]
TDSPDPPNPNPALTLEPGGLGWITFDDLHRSVNLFNHQVMGEFARRLSEARALSAAGDLRALVLWSGKADSFFVGADVAAIRGVTDARQGEEVARKGQDVFQELASLPIPTLAAIHGVCVGGGLEMALACHSRVVSQAPETRLGLPEILLGLLPGWGGTSRLPRTIGIRSALAVILSGKRYRWDESVALGLADQAFPASGFRDQVSEYARRLADGLLPPRRRPPPWDRLLESTAVGRRRLLAVARRRVEERTGSHYPAPKKVLEVVDESFGLPLNEALALEAEALGVLIATPVSRNLLHIYQLRQDARKDRGIPPTILSLPRLPEGDAPPRGEAEAMVSRILEPFLQEARTLREEGSSERLVDGAARAFGMAAGPFEILRGEARRKTPVGSLDHVLQDRLILPMVNEAARVLAEEKWERAGAVDLALILGGGFPPFRGGLLRHADDEGLGTMVERLHALSQRFGPRFRPAGLMEELARSGQTFYHRFP